MAFGVWDLNYLNLFVMGFFSYEFSVVVRDFRNLGKE